VLQNISWLLFLNKLYFTNAIWRINEYLIYDEKNYCTSSGFALSCAEMQQVMNQFPNARIGGLDIAGGLKEALNNGISNK
jgi:hypothetical protein